MQPHLQTLNDRDLLDLASLVFEVETKLRSLGFLKNAKPSTVASVFDSIASEKSPQAIAELKRMNIELSAANASTAMRALSIDQLRRFISSQGLDLRDEETVDAISNDDVIEVFDNRGVQVWRNWRYFEFCPYTPAELLTMDWHTLYERPAAVANKLLSLMPTLFNRDAKMIAYDVPEYAVSARKYPEAPCMLLKMKVAAPLFNSASQPTMFISTGQVTVLESARRGKNLDFI